MAVPYGPVSDCIVEVLSSFQFFNDYREGRITKDEFASLLDENSSTVDEAFDGESVFRRLASRYPVDFDAHADTIFGEIIKQGILKDRRPIDGFGEFRELMKSEYDHDERDTYIQPDEARLLYLVSKTISPQLMIAVGSYYGYWTAWAIPGVRDGNGKAFLIDPNESVCELARRNFAGLGYSNASEVLCAKAEEALPTIPDGADLILLDASGSSDHPDPTYHGKGVYGHVIPFIFEKLNPGGILAVHNDCVSVNRPDPLDRFHDFCARSFRKSLTADTPEGFGIYLK